MRNHIDLVWLEFLRQPVLFLVSWSGQVKAFSRNQEAEAFQLLRKLTIDGFKVNLECLRVLDRLSEPSNTMISLAKDKGWSRLTGFFVQDFLYDEAFFYSIEPLPCVLASKKKGKQDSTKPRLKLHYLRLTKYRLDKETLTIAIDGQSEIHALENRKLEIDGFSFLLQSAVSTWLKIRK